MLHNSATTDHMSIHLHYLQHGFGALQAMLIVHSDLPVEVTQANCPLEMEHSENHYERDIALLPDEPLIVQSENAHMLLIYSGNRFVRINELDACSVTADGLTVIGGQA